jgi:hypothetical protein
MGKTLKIEIKGIERMAEISNQIFQSTKGVKNLFFKRLNRKIRQQIYQDNKKQGYKTKRKDLDKILKIYTTEGSMTVRTNTTRRRLNPTEKNASFDGKGNLSFNIKGKKAVKNPKIFFMATMGTGHSGIFTRHAYAKGTHKLVPPNIHGLFSQQGKPRTDKRFKAQGIYSKKYKVSSRMTFGRHKITEAETISVGNEIKETYRSEEIRKDFGSFLYETVNQTFKDTLK